MIRSNCSFEIQRQEDRLILILKGEIDHHCAVQIRTELDTLLYEERPSNVVLDLAEIEFMDSSGLGLIMGRYALMKKLGGELILRNANPRLVKIFELAGLERIVKMEEKREEDPT